MAANYEKTSISVPSEILQDLDEIAAKWFTSRSGAIVRIYQEWKQARERAEATEADTAEVVEV